MASICVQDWGDEERGPKGRGRGGVLGEGQLASPPHQLRGLGERCKLPSEVRAEARPLLILVLFEPRRTLVEATIII